MSTNVLDQKKMALFLRPSNLRSHTLVLILFLRRRLISFLEITSVIQLSIFVSALGYPKHYAKFSPDALQRTILGKRKR